MEYDRWFIIITKFDLGNSAIAASALAALALAASALATLISRALPYYSRIISRNNLVYRCYYLPFHQIVLQLRNSGDNLGEIKDIIVL